MSEPTEPKRELERIWVEPITGQQPSYGSSQWGLWHPAKPFKTECTEYVRADLLAEARAEIEELMNTIRRFADRAEVKEKE